MSVRTTALVLVSVALVAVAAVVLGNPSAYNPSVNDRAGVGSSEVETGVAGNGAGRSDAATPSPGSSAKHDNPAAPGKSTPDESKRDSAHGSEPGPSAATPTPYRLPGAKPAAPQRQLISAPLPPSASARGSIVKGFPEVIAQAPKSTVMFSSVATQGRRMQVGLDATTSISALDVLSFYRAAFEPLGLVASTAPAVTGSTALAFVRGDNGITVTASDSAGSTGSHYTVTGVLSAGT
jgi:hypothetical protein